MKFLLSLLFICSAAQAHVDPGHYHGLDQNAKACEFEVLEAKFENNQPHPLNERIPVTNIKFSGLQIDRVWDLAHPPVVDLNKGLARFNHDLFQLVVPTASGATSVVLLKGDEEKEGHAPKGIIYIDDNYRQSVNSKSLSCVL
jgi:hypothetical protein